jgi:hypothetical protein
MMPAGCRDGNARSGGSSRLESGFRPTVLLPALAYVLTAVLTLAIESKRSPLSGSATSVDPRA